MAEKTIDVCGEICPDPLTLTMKAMEPLAAGNTLEVVLDSPNALETITRWAERAGHEILSVTEPEPGQWKLTIGKARKRGQEP